MTDRSPSRLLLIKHAAPEIVEHQPAAQWRLSAHGRSAAAALGDRLRESGIEHLVSSQEPKAVETAEQIAQRLGVECSRAEDLHEHVRTSAPFLPGPGEFRAAVERVLAEPDRLSFGDETANQAYRRFAAAVEKVIANWASPGPVCIVAHGTVISVLAERWTGTDAVQTWRALGLPSFVEITLPDRRLARIESE